MDLLYLCHCVPNPPDKGEKIRSYQEVRYLASRHSVHLVCFARNEADIDSARQLESSCASVYVERLRTFPALAAAGLRFLGGASLAGEFFGSAKMRSHVQTLASQVPLAVSIAFSTPMAAYAPEQVPLLLDMVDVDSEKWREYSKLRWPGLPYAIESRRLRACEVAYASRAECTFLATNQECELFRSFAPEPRSRCIENGVDFDYFSPAATPIPAELRGRSILAFVGAMDYYPNADAATWFAEHVFALLREREPDLEFFIVGRNPGSAVKNLAQTPGITVTGSVPDVRPYLAAARAFVAPLRIARGIQNKVLEALAMNKPVLASGAVCQTFGDLPRGVLACSSPADYGDGWANLQNKPNLTDIRSEAQGRFSWQHNLDLLDEWVERSATVRQPVCP